jgi:AraC family transcriptional regulator
MHAEPGANLTVEYLARQVDLSPAHFARAFKETTGRAPHRYLLTLRLEWARRLLDVANPVLSEIALRTGFSDQSHFTRLFKREFGITPGAVLRNRRAQQKTRAR